MKYEKEYIVRSWQYEQKLKYKDKEYTVHKMSYGDYFLEPIVWKGGENDGFSSQTIWLEKEIINNKVFYSIKE
jgi:hypothetical protein